jgi:hypothetical protein
MDQATIVVMWPIIPDFSWSQSETIHTIIHRILEFLHIKWIYVMLWSKGHDGCAILSLCNNKQKKHMLPILFEHFIQLWPHVVLMDY